MYGQPVQLFVINGWIIHIDGTPWYQQPLPRRWHLCWPSSTARLGVMYPDLYQRCPCGGWRVHFFGAINWTEWHDRNSRRRGTAHNLTVL